MEKVAKRSSCTNLPLPTQRARLDIERTFSEQEYSRLSQGLIPGGMDDKWFIFMENDILSFHRSWTGVCVYVVHFDSKRTMNEVWVNRDSEQYRQTDNEYDEKLLMFLIDNFLLGQSTPFPIPSDIAKESPKGLYQHSFSGTGYSEKEFQKKES